MANIGNNCNKTSNNKYFDCYARMDDARAFTDYRPSVDVDNMLRKSNNVMSSYDYRQFLIHNADNIIIANNEYTRNTVECTSCDAINIPFNQNCVYNNKYPDCNILDKNGIGLLNTVSENTGIKDIIYSPAINENYEDKLYMSTNHNNIYSAPGNLGF